MTNSLSGSQQESRVRSAAFKTLCPKSCYRRLDRAVTVLRWEYAPPCDVEDGGVGTLRCLQDDDGGRIQATSGLMLHGWPLRRLQRIKRRILEQGVVAVKALASFSLMANSLLFTVSGNLSLPLTAFCASPAACLGLLAVIDASCRLAMSTISCTTA
ncbi:hypothetical protein FB45DRAFT_27274 [Roridomyces roridus]|uniref:Uncharacterized protein n=1 Tax=Roridomyces roridus TaxID=1738132 RepID=A0AAD7CK22_9AGAR|nr:hypothetical protein FB45DRAFT_27274 [Roridomyces roridus]